MRRREFIAALGGVAAWPLTTQAQQSDREKRVGVLMLYTDHDPDGQARLLAFQRALTEQGWPNAQIDARWGFGSIERLRSGALELIADKVDVIWTLGMEPTIAAREATLTTPIVFTAVSDPIVAGFAASLSHPAGNMTGFSSYEPATAGKWMELLHEIAPSLTYVLFIHEPEHPVWGAYLRAAETIAAPAGIRLIPMAVRSAADIEAAFKMFGSEPKGGVLVIPGIAAIANRDALVQLAAQYRLPAVYPAGFFTDAGGLMSYSFDIIDASAHVADYVARILRGEKAGELPIQQPTKFKLVVNLKTAKALGLEIPESFLLRADEVIE